MGQVSPYLRKAAGGHSHWCPGCEQMHMIPDTWMFDGNVNSPTFSPSVKITGKKCLFANGKWVGWVLDAAGKPIDDCCHYILTAGQLNFCDDCTHALVGQTVPLPQLPEELMD